MLEKQMYIGGKWVDAESKDKLKVINPAYGEVFAEVPKARKEDVQKAISAAGKAFEGWSFLSPGKRGAYLRKASDIVLERVDEIAKLMTAEQGKPYKLSLIHI